MFRVFMCLVLVVGLAACGSIKQVGTIGNYNIHKVATTDAVAPSTTTIVAEGPDGEICVINKAGGAGVVGTIAAPVAGIASAAIIARGMEQAARNQRPDILNVKNGNKIKNEGSKAVAAAGSYSSSQARSSSSVRNNNVNHQTQGQGQLQGQGQMQEVDQSKHSLF